MYGIKVISAAAAAAFVLAACGGGGDGGTDTPVGGGGGGGNGGTNTPVAAGEPIKGVWTGGATSTENTTPLKWDTTSVALPDGRVFVVSSEFYGAADAPERNLFGALLVGKGTATNNAFSFANGQEFSFESDWEQRSASVEATYATKNSLQGRISYPAQGDVTPAVRDFTSTYAPSYEGTIAFSELAYNNATIRSIQGAMLKSNPDVNTGFTRYPVTLLVNETDGTLSSRFPDTECNVTGKLTPSDDGIKVFEAEITFNSTVANRCPYAAGTTLSGVAFLKDSVATTRNVLVTQNRFHLAVSNTAQDQGVVFAQVLD